MHNIEYDKFMYMYVWYMYPSNQIADFGVSEEIEQTESNLTRWAGTPAFVAPECLTGNQPNEKYQ